MEMLNESMSLTPFKPGSYCFCRILYCMFLIVLSVSCAMALGAEKTRIFILTDIENEPDDAQSLVRFLLYANQFDVEGLVATTSVHQRNKTAAWGLPRVGGRD